MLGMDHPNVVRFHALVTSARSDYGKWKVGLILELAEEKSLKFRKRSYRY